MAVFHIKKHLSKQIFQDGVRKRTIHYFVGLKRHQEQGQTFPVLKMKCTAPLNMRINNAWRTVLGLPLLVTTAGQTILNVLTMILWKLVFLLYSIHNLCVTFFLQFYSFINFLYVIGYSVSVVALVLSLGIFFAFRSVVFA